MRKKIIDRHGTPSPGESDQVWLDLQQIATVEVTSEDPNFPVESAFGLKDGPGWRAAEKGDQQIRIVFDEPVPLHRIQLRFSDTESERTQEFTVRYSSVPGGPISEIVRQQWNFSPSGSTTELEDYTVNLEAVSVLELAIRPDIGRRESVASLASLRLG